jgi:hypothetical protein
MNAPQAPTRRPLTERSPNSGVKKRIPSRCCARRVGDEQTGHITASTRYKHAFVSFIRSLQWDWFITVPIGECPHDDLILKLLRRIEAHFCKKYVSTRYHKLPDVDRFLMAVAFEGESRSGSRHAHLLVRIPSTNKMQVSKSRLIATFPFEFRLLWLKFKRTAMADENLFPYQRRGDSNRKAQDLGMKSLLSFGRANVARQIYAVKRVREAEVLWSRFEFVTPRKFETFNNENLRGGSRASGDRRQDPVWPHQGQEHWLYRRIFDRARYQSQGSPGGR